MMIKTECQILEKKEKCVTTVLKQFRVQNFHFKRQETAKKIGLENGKKARIFETCNFCFTKNKIYLFWKLLNFWIFFDDNSIVLSEEKTKKGRNGEREELNVNYLYLLENRQRAIAQYDPGILLSLPFSEVMWIERMVKKRMFTRTSTTSNDTVLALDRLQLLSFSNFLPGYPLRADSRQIPDRRTNKRDSEGERERNSKAIASDGQAVWWSFEHFVKTSKKVTREGKTKR